MKINGSKITVMKSKGEMMGRKKAKSKDLLTEGVGTFKLHIGFPLETVQKSLVEKLVGEYGRVVEIVCRNNSAFVVSFFKMNFNFS